MSDDPQPPAAPEHNAADGQGASATGGDARDPWAPEKSVRETTPGAALDSDAIPVVRDDPDPWAAPAGPGMTVASSGPVAPVPPSVHDQQTVTSMPTADGNPAPAQPWAAPAPSTGGPGAYPPPNPFAPPGPGTPPAGTPHQPGTPSAGTPYAPPTGPAAPPQGAVPAPAIAPDGPGRAPYGYPAAGYAYPAQPVHAGQHAPGHHHQPYPGWTGMPAMPNNGLGTAALIVGIVSVVGFCLWPLAIVTGVLGVVFGVIGRQRASRGEATNGGQALAGIICGAVGAVVGILLMLALFLA